jgi:hypothetical protein
MDDISEDQFTTQALGFLGGYVAYGEALRPGADEDSAYFWPMIWTSRDGLDWTVTEPANLVTPCEGWVPRVDLSFETALSDGERVVLFGTETDPSATVCGPDGNEAWRSVAWFTDNARDWERELLAWPVRYPWELLDAWTYQGRWEAIAEPPDYPVPGKPLVLQSLTGIGWSVATELDVTLDGQTTMVGAVGADGTRIIALQSSDEDLVLRLRTSRDGKTWTEMTTPFTGPNVTDGVERDIQHVIAPTRESSVWTFAFSVGDDCAASDERAQVWTSTDLQNWTSSPFPWVIARIDYMVVTRLGLIARGGDVCDVTGGPGPPTPDGDRLFISRDGVSWQPLPPDVGQASGWIVDGPGGVLLIDGLQVWRLVETTD